MSSVIEAFKSDELYYSDKKYVSNSGLGRMRENVHLFAAWLRGDYDYPSNPHFTVGRYFHTYVLEPHKLNDFHISKMKTRRSAQFNADVQKFSDKEVITDSERAMVENMVFKIKSIDRLTTMIEASEKEVPFVKDIEGVPCKGKLDMVLTMTPQLVDELEFGWAGMRVGLDLKSTSKPVSEFKKSARAFNYARQAAMYTELADLDAFVFIPSEKSFPYTPAMYWSGEDFLSAGYRQLFTDLQFYRELFIEGKYKSDYLYEVTL